MASLRPPERAYRYFEEEAHADALVRGEVWISTLHSVRAADTARADPGDGVSGYHVSKVDDDTPIEVAQIIWNRVERHGLLTPGAGDSGVTLEDIVMVDQIEGYVLCTTLIDGEHMQQEFGHYCVKITKPHVFFQRVTEALRRLMPMDTHLFAPVQYLGRTFADAEAEPGPPGFKSILKFKEEREARMLWMPTGMVPRQGFVLHVPEVAELCVRIS